MQKLKNVILLFIVVIKIVKSNDENVPMVVTDGNRIVETLNIVLYDKSYQKNSEINIDISAKIGYLSHFYKLEYILDKYQNFYNNRWIFIIEDNITWNSVGYYLLENNYPSNICAFIWIDRLEGSYYENNHYPVFISDFVTFQKLKSYNVENERGNYFLNIKYNKHSPSRIFNNYLLMASIISAGYCLVMIILWHYTNYKIYFNYITSLQKALTFLPYMKFILSLLLIYYASGSTDSNNETFNSAKIYLDIFIMTLNSIFKTIFWFVIIVVSCGWQIHRYTFTTIELRRFMMVYVFIYISICFDQYMDSIINVRIWNFEFSELKNFVIYSIFVGISSFYTSKSIKFLKTKLYYANILAPEFLPSLILKMRMLYLHIIVALLYTILYILCVTTQKFIMPDSSLNFSLINCNLIDIIALTLYLFIFRARQFPPYFEINYVYLDAAIKNGYIFSVNLPPMRKLLSASTVNDFGLVNQLVKNDKTDIETPFIVINPIFHDNIGINNSNYGINITDSFSSNTISYKHSSINEKLSIGFVKNH